MLYIGFYCTKKGGSGNTGEFYLGGRQLGPLVTAMSAEASDMRLAWSVATGMPGVAYLTGVAECGRWTAIGLAIGNVFELVPDRGQAASPVFGKDRFHYDSGSLFQTLS